MSKTIDLTISAKNFRSKTDIAIDMFTEMLKNIAIKDEIRIETKYDIKERILKIYAKSYGICVDDRFLIDDIVDYIFDIKRMKLFAQKVYRVIRHTFIRDFEEIENYQKEKAEIDEHWEFVELGGM